MSQREYWLECAKALAVHALGYADRRNSFAYVADIRMYATRSAHFYNMAMLEDAS